MVEKLESSGRFFYYTTDISSLADVKKLEASIRRDVGKPVTILVNNAGDLDSAKVLLELSEDEIKRIFGVNVLAHFWTCQVFLPEMQRLNRGHIVNVASVLGKKRLFNTFSM